MISLYSLLNQNNKNENNDGSSTTTDTTTTTNSSNTNTITTNSSNNEKGNSSNGVTGGLTSTNDAKFSLSTNDMPPFPTNMLKSLLENSELLELLLKPISSQNVSDDLGLNANKLDKNNTNNTNVTTTTTTTTNNSTTNTTNTNVDSTNNDTTTPTNTNNDTNNNSNNQNNDDLNTNIDLNDDDIALKLKDLSTFDITDEEFLFLKEDKLENEDSQFSSRVYGNEFLGPSLWDKTDLFPSDKFGFKFECMELDDVLTENGFNMSKNEFLDELNKIENEHQSQENNNDKNNKNNNNNNITTSTSNNTTTTKTTGTIAGSNSSITISKNNSNNNLPSEPVGWSGHNNASRDSNDFLNSLFKPTLSPSSSSSSSLPTSSSSSLSPSNEKNNHSGIFSSGFSLFGPLDKSTNAEDLRARLKKNRKQIIPNELKDDRYWVRRRKNNLAAKRSRDAKRIRENQITLRAAFLERENDSLKKQLDQFKSESKQLKMKLMRYEAAMQQSLFGNLQNANNNT